jgi:hypothetical protein
VLGAQAESGGKAGTAVFDSCCASASACRFFHRWTQGRRIAVLVNPTDTDFILWCLHCHHCKRFFIFSEDKIGLQKQDDRLVGVKCPECDGTDDYWMSELVSIHY